MVALDWNLGGAVLRTWLIAGAVTLGSLILLYLFKRLVVNRLQHLAKRTNTEVDDVLADLLNRTHFWFYLCISLFFGSRAASLPDPVATPLRSLVVVALFIQVALWGNGLITFWTNRYRERMITQDPAWATTVTALGFVGRIIVWAVLLLLVLQNLGFEIDSLIAGLGVGGIAVALAVQSILGDLFASLSIVMDKPFLIGDFITVDQFSGTVEHVGLKTTRIRSLTGEQLVISNGDLLKSRIRNYKRMQERRAVFLINVTYSTPEEKLEAIPQMVRQIVESREQTRFDRAHLKEFGPYALVFEVVYWITTPDFLTYMDTQQAVNLALIRRFREESIEFAIPTQVLQFREGTLGLAAAGLEEPPKLGG